MNFNLLFHQYFASSLDKQFTLKELVGDSNWHFDMSSGLISFGDRYHFHVQILGTESYDSQTWLWAWANEMSDIPLVLQQCSLMLKTIGEFHQIREFTVPQMDLGEIDGHSLAMIASGACNANAYYRCPYEGGAAFILLNDPTFLQSSEPPLNRILSIFTQVISAIKIENHKLAMIGYLDYYRLKYEVNGNSIIVTNDCEQQLRATFDDLNRLTQLESIIQSKNP